MELDRFTFTYPEKDRPALEEVSLRIAEGEAVALLGPAGCGKSTLGLACIGLVPHSTGGRVRGSVKLFGEEFSLHLRHRMAERIAAVFQDPESQLFCATVEEEAAFALENFGVPPDRMAAQIGRALQKGGLAGFEARSPMNLSGGEQQRLALACALAQEPSLLLLDEPTGSLDPIGRAELRAALLELRRLQGLTVLYLTEDPEEAIEHAERILLMAGGHLVGEYRPEELLNDPSPLEALGLRAPQLSAVWRILAQRRLQPVAPVPRTGPSAAAFLLRSVRVPRPSGQAGRRATVEAAPEASASPAPPAAECRSVSYRYEEGPAAVEGLTLTIRAGEFAALVGSNGSGKTTLAKLLVGLLRPTAGELFVFGQGLEGLTVAQIARSVGFLFQHSDHQLYCSTVEEEVAAGPRNLGLAPEEVAQRTAGAIAQLGLEALRRAPPAALGAGERRRIALAAVLAMGPRLLILDEPTRGLGWIQSRQLLDHLVALNASGVTILMITHDLRLVAEYARRILILARGQLIADGPPEALLGEANLLATTGLKPPTLYELARGLRSHGPLPPLPTPEAFVSALPELLEG